MEVVGQVLCLEVIRGGRTISSVLTSAQSTRDGELSSTEYHFRFRCMYK